MRTGPGEVVPASPLEDSAVARSVSVGSLVLVDQAESSSERKSQQLLTSMSQTGEASQEVRVGCRLPAFRTQSVESKPAP